MVAGGEGGGDMPRPNTHSCTLDVGESSLARSTTSTRDIRARRRRCAEVETKRENQDLPAAKNLGTPELRPPIRTRSRENFLTLSNHDETMCHDSKNCVMCHLPNDKLSQTELAVASRRPRAPAPPASRPTAPPASRPTAHFPSQNQWPLHRATPVICVRPSQENFHRVPVVEYLPRAVLRKKRAPVARIHEPVRHERHARRQRLTPLHQPPRQLQHGHAPIIARQDELQLGGALGDHAEAPSGRSGHREAGHGSNFSEERLAATRGSELAGGPD